MSEPREGLPPCVSVTVFEDRRVFMRDIRECSHGWEAEYEEGILVVADTLDSLREPDSYDWHPGCYAPAGRGPKLIWLLTDDPAEAQAAFERGAEWVRTGEMA